MRRFVLIVLLVVTAATTGSCATDPSHASPVVLHRCGPVSPDATDSSTSTAPCTTTTTTTTTPPAPLALGSVATLSDQSPDRTVASQVTVSISRIWTGVSPVPGPPGFDLAQALRYVGAPASYRWVGVGLTMVNTGPQVIQFVSAPGPAAQTLTIVVDGHRGGAGVRESSLLPQIGFDMGVAGCAYPFAGGGTLAPGVRATGCLAVPVPTGVDVSSLGFDLTGASGGAPHHAAVWQA